MDRHDGTKAEGLEEGEVGGFGEAGAENAIINHGEVEGRNEEILAVVVSGGGVIGDSELDLAAHGSVLFVPLVVVMGALEFCRHLHICLFVCFKREREGGVREVFRGGVCESL